LKHVKDRDVLPRIGPRIGCNWVNAGFGVGTHQNLGEHT
jgi:hypothetical protein